VAQTVKASACSAGDLGSIPGSGRSPGELFSRYRVSVWDDGKGLEMDSGDDCPRM